MTWGTSSSLAIAMDRIRRMTVHLEKGYWRERRRRHRLDARTPACRLKWTPRWQLRRPADPMLFAPRRVFG